MSESPEPGVDSEAEATKPNRSSRALTWIGIVAGTVFILGAIFVVRSNELAQSASTASDFVATEG
jgi:hypothetical protein